MTGRLEGKTALVIGAAGRNNMGQVIARRFAKEGARVIVAGRKMDELERLASEIGGRAAKVDVTSKSDLVAAADFARQEFGYLDIALNATGWGLLKGFQETTEEDFDAMSALQFKGPFLFLQAMVAAMDTTTGGRGGSIIQISSATAKIMFHDHAAYMGAKAGTDHLVRVVANEFGAHGIRANTISPGLTASPMTHDAMQVPGLESAFLKGYPLGRIGTAEDIAAAAVFLASDECFMTGEDLQVSGGLTLRRNPTRDEIDAAVAAATGASGG
ncbi:SDR family NAD(P)-dependent oxidoreductase [Novosphingobium sp. Leaf2]|uniref:SDR family NAD(P)-dependent oxidoreductase n=1 Tax=Novosphingobium sp. Leaf2 TaxID=1735670 RepID=UPI0006FA2604|nr:SDR family oxidoreductase [Novosphingobium sp. Leaf2]KQM18249.1 oxidoreductase [Novosphingobium sp. Leaf2]